LAAWHASIVIKQHICTTPENMCDWLLHHQAKPSIAQINVFVLVYLIQIHVPNHATCAQAMTQAKHFRHSCSKNANCTLLVWLLSRCAQCFCNIDQQLKSILLQWHCLLRHCKLLPFVTYTIQQHYNVCCCCIAKHADFSHKCTCNMPSPHAATFNQGAAERCCVVAILDHKPSHRWWTVCVGSNMNCFDMFEWLAPSKIHVLSNKAHCQQLVN
jgi:hypothetical protein